MSRERKSSERGRKGDWIVVGSRKGHRSRIQNLSVHHLESRTPNDVRAGNRGVSRHPRWRGPREPPPS
ncbi:unnamed protein product [Amaranthus hypochondriacus]